eukprot:Skav207894  [mRNA]  locus=scaffold2233:41451:42899:- [translate_table: standard]
MPKTCGVVLLSYQQACQWVEESHPISPDELALLIVGRHNISTKLAADMVQVPCKHKEGRPVILACTMIQMGERAIKTPDDAHPPITEEACTTISKTFWQEDWCGEDWAKIIDQPFQFAKALLSKQGFPDVLQATWGKSLRQGGVATTMQMATSAQFHATVRTTALQSLLATSGYNKMFIVPKSVDGRICQSWRIIWLDGSWAHISALAMKTKNCTGIVKNRSSFGLRFHKDFHQEAWKQLCPDKPFPQRIEVKHLYKIEPLPHGTTVSMLELWAKNNAWSLQPIKPLGPVPWLVGSDSPAPCDILKFNGNPLILKWLAPKGHAQANPIIAGPAPRKPKGKGKGKGVETPAEDPFGPHFDPWHGYEKRIEPAPSTRELTGPTEARFQKQDEQIAAMEAAITQLKQDTQNEFVKVEQRAQNNMLQVKQTIGAVKEELANSFQKSLSQQSESINSTLLDLKALLKAQPKRGRTKAEDEEMEEDTS